MALVAYIRVSSTGQSLDVQRDKMIAAGVEAANIFEEKRSGVDANRPALKECLRFVRRGDTLLITKIDRLARSQVDFHNILNELERKGVGFKAIDDALIDTTTPSGKLVLGVLAAVAQFETNIRKERQMDGIAKAKEKGIAFGRKPTDDAVKATIISLRSEGKLIREIMKATGLSKATVYRALA